MKTPTVAAIHVLWRFLLKPLAAIALAREQAVLRAVEVNPTQGATSPIPRMPRGGFDGSLQRVDIKHEQGGSTDLPAATKPPRVGREHVVTPANDARLQTSHTASNWAPPRFNINYSQDAPWRKGPPTQWPQMGGVDFVAPPTDIFRGVRNYPFYYRGIYVAACPGQCDLSRALRIPLGKPGCFGPRGARKRIGELSAQEYAAARRVAGG